MKNEEWGKNNDFVNVSAHDFSTIIKRDPFTWYVLMETERIGLNSRNDSRYEAIVMLRRTIWLDPSNMYE